MADPLVGPRPRHTRQLIWITVSGFLLGGLLTELSVSFLPDSAPRTFLTTSVVAQLDPSTIDVIGVNLTLGLGLTFNFPHAGEHERSRPRGSVVALVATP